MPSRKRHAVDAEQTAPVISDVLGLDLPMSFPRFAETSLESSSPSAPGLSRSEGGIVVVVDVAGGGVKWIELPSVLYVLIMAHLSIADLVHIDQTCRHLQTAARLATPACSTLCMEIPDYGGPRPLTPIPDEAILRFLPRHLTAANSASNQYSAISVRCTDITCRNRCILPGATSVGLHVRGRLCIYFPFRVPSVQVCALVFFFFIRPPQDGKKKVSSHRQKKNPRKTE